MQGAGDGVIALRLYRVVRSTVNVAKTNSFLVIKIDRRPNETQRILLLLKARVLSTILIMFMTIAVA